MTHSLLRAAAFAAFAVLTLVLGCGGSTPPSPTTPDNQAQNPGAGINGSSLSRSGANLEEPIRKPDAGP